MPCWLSLRLCGGGALVALLASCGGDAVPPPHGGAFVPDAGSATTTTTIVNGLCTPARASEDLTPRSDLTGMGSVSAGGTQLVTTSDLFARFRSICGDCHVSQANGGRQVDQNTFATMFDDTWLVPVKSDDPKVYMPPAPNGKPYSTRSSGDPLVQLVAYVEAWLAQGRPKDMFTVESHSSNVSSGGYMFTPEIASGMTNLGNCVPNKDDYAQSTSGAMESLDTFFASATELPPNLTGTDLTTFDGDVLAQNGVIAYVPTYPLWSDGSGKLRHIRVPKGQSVAFNKEKQSFSIPPNTRFYKTFFRKVVDRTGHVRNRKMETRVIVARPDTTDPDGTIHQNALFGTYIWSDDETTALLANLPYRDGSTHADQVRTYVTDELTYQEIIDGVGPGADFQTQLKVALDQALIDNPSLIRHYAIPGRIRCVQCHMGSVTEDFVLGFFPLQVARRATDTGGTYEPTGEDELNQLQRLIDVGLITGMSSPADVVQLEASQGKRKPRTPQELNAQAYMVGNCGHCHNERGFPSITKPELASVLDFYPDPDHGGIFEMSLDTMSPVRTRGANGDVPIPYITPSLYDYPVATAEGMIRVDNRAQLGTPDGERTWSPKYLSDITETVTPGEQVADCAKDDEHTRPYCGDRKTGLTFVLAPWRSLIYRNVDTPFPYFDDYVPFPHMPANTPGFDCRAPRIMADWMVSLPAARKYPELPEDRLPTNSAKRGDHSYDDSPQPYVEVRPGDLKPDGTPAFPDATAAAQKRLDAYHASVRYPYCQDDLGPDIYDPIGYPNGGHGYLPQVSLFTFGGDATVPNPKDPDQVLPPLGVPFHAHWFNYDPTDSPPPWSPRRPDWNVILPPGSPPDTSTPGRSTSVPPDLAASRKLVVAAINESSLTKDLHDFALKEQPFGLWTVKPECQQQLAGQKKASDFASSPPAWMAKKKPDPSAPVYMSAPGATLYRHICFNCHGPKADGKGLQGDALAAASEGEARPANFREGLFGPSAKPGSNLASAFNLPQLATSGVDAVGWASRYMAWMALGGTLAVIPQNIIYQVEATRVLGESRQNLKYLAGSNQVSANMLNLAKGICGVILPDTGPQSYYFNNYTQFKPGLLPEAYPPYNAGDSPFIDSNGDKEMWLDLCTRFSPKVVHVYTASGTDRDHVTVDLTALYYADGYPADAPVLDHNGTLQKGISTDSQAPNFYPACLQTPTDPALADWLADKPIITKLHMPTCPTSFIAGGRPLWKSLGTPADIQVYADNVGRWALRGAIAAGMSVFTYLQNGGSQMGVKPYFNECQLLAK